MSSHPIIRIRRGTAAEWSASQPQPDGEILKLGEPGYEKDTGKLKIGDGTSGWNLLPYFNDGAAINTEELQDLIGDGGFLVEGDGIGISYDDNANTLTISNTKSTYDAAVEWTANHTLVDGTRYLAGDLVYSGGYLYRAKFDNESEPVTNATYWENVGAGYRLNIDGRDIQNVPYPVTSVNSLTGSVNTYITPVIALGTLSGSNAINAGFPNCIQTLTLNGSAVTFTKGSNWSSASSESTDVVLKITVSSATTITWTIVDEWYNQPDAGALVTGTHLFLLRGVGSIVEGHYIGAKTN